MLSDRQIKMANSLLKYLVEKEGRANKDAYSSIMKVLGYNWGDVSYLREILVDEGLLEEKGQSNYWLYLTKDGWIAAKMGIIEYFEKQEEDSKPAYNVNMRDNYGQITQSSFVENKVDTTSPNPKPKRRAEIIIGIISIVLAAITIAVMIILDKF